MLRKKVNRKRTPYDKFKNFLNDNNIPQSEIAELTGKSVSAINQNLNGTGGDFSLSDVRLICLKYGISAEVYFIAENVSKTTTNNERAS